eukprot:2021915-Ditylum_brightwellii.AAC.1
MSNYPGENVHDLKLDILNYSSKLDCTGAFTDDLLIEIYVISEEASDLKFKMWAINEHQACKERIHHKKLG